MNPAPLFGYTDGMMPVLIPLAPAHAADAARLHILGQPGTFLTSLGPDVLTVLYAALPDSPFGFGFAVTCPTRARLLGFVAATPSIAGLFLEMGTVRLPAFAPPLLRRIGERPDLMPRAAQTLLYPMLARAGGSDATGPAAPDPGTPVAAVPTLRRRSAELLSIMVEPEARSRGIGALLIHVLAEECIRREIDHLDVTVDAGNDGARRFYARHGFTQRRTFALYGRPMCLYALELRADTGGVP